MLRRGLELKKNVSFLCIKLFENKQNHNDSVVTGNEGNGGGYCKGHEETGNIEYICYLDASQ